MRKTVFVVLALALIGLVSAAGCISTPEETASPVGVWLVPGQDVMLFISIDGTYSGHAQVNSFSGIYTFDGDKLTFGEPVSTLMAGPGLEEEKAFFAALASVDSYFISEGGKLVLKSGEEVVLVLTPSLVGTWEGDGGMSVTFNSDMTFSGHGPINGFGGTYSNTEERLVITPEHISSAVGSDEEMEAEAAFLAALAAAKDYYISDGKLTLLDDIVLEDENALITLTGTVYGTYQNQYGDTLVLNSDGTFSGQAPVNTFKGTYGIVDGCVVLKDFSITKMAGSEDDMRHEASFLEKLEAEEYTFVIDSFLFGSDGNTMLHIFFRV